MVGGGAGLATVSAPVSAARPLLIGGERSGAARSGPSELRY